MTDRPFFSAFLCFVIIAAVFACHAAFSAENTKKHGDGMGHCMQSMDAHCRMNQAMEKMEKEMAAHRAMQHCMPNMTAHCQIISDLEYMEKRMESMRVSMQHCMENEKDCPMPEMSGEMSAMRERMAAMASQMQGFDKQLQKNKEKVLRDTPKSSVEEGKTLPAKGER